MQNTVPLHDWLWNCWFIWEHWTHFWKSCRIYGPRYREDRRFQRGTINWFSLPSKHFLTNMIHIKDRYLKIRAHLSFNLLDSNTIQPLQQEVKTALTLSDDFPRTLPSWVMLPNRSWHRLDMQTCNQSTSVLQGRERNKHKSCTNQTFIRTFISTYDDCSLSRVFTSDLRRDPPLSAGTRDEIGRIGRLTSAAVKIIGVKQICRVSSIVKSTNIDNNMSHH